MMHRVIYAPEADAQLVALYFHIAAAASPEIAARYTGAIVRQCESLMTFPMRGTRRDDIALACAFSVSGVASASPSRSQVKWSLSSASSTADKT